MRIRFDFGLQNVGYFNVIGPCHEIWAIYFRGGPLMVAVRDVHSDARPLPYYLIDIETFENNSLDYWK